MAGSPPPAAPPNEPVVVAEASHFVLHDHWDDILA